MSTPLGTFTPADFSSRLAAALLILCALFVCPSYGEYLDFNDFLLNEPGIVGELLLVYGFKEQKAAIKPLKERPANSSSVKSHHAFYGFPILGNGGIYRKQQHAFRPGLGQQQTIKRVFVKEWQCFDRQDVFRDHRQFGVSMGDQHFSQTSRVYLKILPSQTPFDYNFPYTGHAEKQDIFRRCQECAR